MWDYLQYIDVANGDDPVMDSPVVFRSTQDCPRVIDWRYIVAAFALGAAVVYFARK